MITANGCTDTSSCYAILTAGLTEKTFSNMLTVFPNPTTDQLTVDLGATRSKVTVEVRNLIGQLMLSTDYETVSQVTLPIQGEAGVYFVTVQTDEGDMASFKILKEQGLC